MFSDPLTPSDTHRESRNSKPLQYRPFYLLTLSGKRFAHERHSGIRRKMPQSDRKKSHLYHPVAQVRSSCYRSEVHHEEN